MITVSVSSPSDTKLDIIDRFNLACFLSRNTENSYFGFVLQSYKEIEDTSDTEMYVEDLTYYEITAAYIGLKVELIMATEKDSDEDCFTYTVILAEMEDAVS